MSSRTLFSPDNGGVKNQNTQTTDYEILHPVQIDNMLVLSHFDTAPSSILSYQKTINVNSFHLF